jgi:hypothetical protein
MIPRYQRRRAPRSPSPESSGANPVPCQAVWDDEREGNPIPPELLP